MRAASLLAVSASLISVVDGAMCNAAVPYSWTQASKTHPELADALNHLSQYAVATWYTDRNPSSIPNLLSKCAGQTPVIVIYGLPGKDCADGFSSGGSNSNSEMYKTWIQNLVTSVGTHEVIYVLEPDAIGLLANNECAVQKGYLQNLKSALGLIQKGNPNAKVYVDVASWSKQAEAIKVLLELQTGGKLDGITINTSNYKQSSELYTICETYSKATGGLHCVFDTSRNYRGTKNDEWCNPASAGIGAPPGTATGSPLVDYNLWIKIPGESDGTCSGRTPEAMLGPNAGDFFAAGFTSLWDNSYFVDKMGLPKIGDSTPFGSKTPPPEAPTAAPITTPSSTQTTTIASTPTTPIPPDSTPYEDNGSQEDGIEYDDDLECEPDDEGYDDEGYYDDGYEGEDTADDGSEYEITSDGSPTSTPTTSMHQTVDNGLNLAADEELSTNQPPNAVGFAVTTLVVILAMGVVVALVVSYKRRRREQDLDSKHNSLVCMGMVTLGTPVEHHGLDTDRGVQVL